MSNRCEACDCTRSIKLPGKPLVDELGFGKEEAEPKKDKFVDMGRIKLNRKKQKEGIQGLKNILKISTSNENSDVKPVFVQELLFQACLPYSMFIKMAIILG